jgi:hypothetical protein
MWSECLKTDAISETLEEGKCDNNINIHRPWWYGLHSLGSGLGPFVASWKQIS